MLRTHELLTTAPVLYWPAQCLRCQVCDKLNRIPRGKRNLVFLQSTQMKFGFEKWLSSGARSLRNGARPCSARGFGWVRLLRDSGHLHTLHR